MKDETDQLLRNLRLLTIRDNLDKELARAEKNRPSYEELLLRLLRSQHDAQAQCRLDNRIKRARIPEILTIESFPFDRQPALRPAQIKQLAELDFVARHQNVVLIGPTGVGKTGIATGLLLKALHNDLRGVFLKAQDLFDELFASVADRSSRRLLDHLARVDLLLIDEMGYLNLRPEQSNLFFKLMDMRHGRHSTLITTNLDYDNWYDFLGKKDMVDALLSRLRHHCVTLRIDGPSLREPDPAA